MSITVSRHRGTGDPCTSSVAKHLEQGAPDAVLDVTIGDADAGLCVECALDTFNALGFMLMGVTDQTLQQLVGLKKKPKVRR